MKNKTMTAKIKPTKPRSTAWVGWIAVTPKSKQPWGEPWLYLRKGKPSVIERSGFHAQPVIVLATDPASVEAMVEKMARALLIEQSRYDCEGITWADLDNEDRKRMRDEARACVAALHPSLKRK